MKFTRNITDTLLRYSKFPVVGVFGPRQSGKTTIVKEVFKNHKYLNFEDPDTREFASIDPKRFLREYSNSYGIILDEFQYVPQILSYIQIESDENRRPGYFVLTGSQNFLMNQAITQSLAGRIGILTLLPLSINELKENNLITENVNPVILNGGYPRIYAENFTPEEFYPSYIHSYVERDIRQLINVENLNTFKKFMQLCTGRIGQLLNLAELAMQCGISQKTANSWISMLEASYILFLLQPHHRNFNKRVIKTPKLYFYDVGLACALLGIKSNAQLAISTFRGHLFENLIISDFLKQYYNSGLKPFMYFWRDKNGTIEVDCVIDKAAQLIPIEIKSTETIMSSLFYSLIKWYTLTKSEPSIGYLVYGGDLTQSRKNGNLVGWLEAGNLIKSIT